MAGVIQPVSDVYKGESRTFRFTVLDEDPTKFTVIVVNGESKTFRGARLDISGVTGIEWQVNYPVGADDPPLISKGLGSGIIMLPQGDPETKGDLEVTLDPADTADLVQKMYKHDLWLIQGTVRKCVIRPSDFPVREPVNRP